MLTLQEIVQEVYDRMWVDSDSTTYWKESRVIPKINSVMYRILSDRKYDVVLQDSQHSPNIKGWDLQFLRKTYSFERIPVKAVKKPAEIWDRNVYINSKEKVPTNWRVLIKWTVYEYELNFNSEDIWLMLKEDIQLPIHQWSVIEFLYKIPEDSEATYQLFAIAWNEENEMVYADYRYPSDFAQYRTVLYKDWINLIRIVSYEARYLQLFKLNYYKKIETLVNDEDRTLFPEDRWDREVLALLTAGELLYETERSDDASLKLNEWYWNLILFYDKFSTANKWYRQDLWWNRNMQHKSFII